MTQRRSNCLLFALSRYWNRGGYVVVLPSLYGWWPHFLWSPDLVHFEDFAPSQKYSRWSPPWLFIGTVCTWTPPTKPVRTTR